MSSIKQKLPPAIFAICFFGMLLPARAQDGPGDPGPDPDPASTTPTTWYRDWDGDGFGDPKKPLTGPTQPAGYVANNLDCNDYRTVYEDKDGDGWGSNIKVPCGFILRNTDCNDNDPKIHSVQTFYRDADGDWYGDANSKIQQCTNTPPAGFVRNSIDCNDADAKVYWPKTYYRDADGDGLGDPANSTNVCSSTPPAGYVNNKKDTNDNPAPPIIVQPSDTRAASGRPVPEATLLRYSISSAPNPFGRHTRIQYSLPEKAQVRIQVFDLVGRQVGLVFSGQRAAGIHYADYNASGLAQGLYYCRMTAVAGEKKVVQTVKLVRSE